MTILGEREHSRRIGKPSSFNVPTLTVLSYVALAVWAAVALFPLYWLFVTWLKLPIDVFEGPFYLPGVDFKMSPHA